MRFARGARVRNVATALLAMTAAMVAPAPALSQTGATHETRGEALRLYDAGRFAEALPLFDQVLARKPHDIDCLNKRGCIYIRMNRPELAIADLTRATNQQAFLAQDAASLGRQFAPDVITAPNGPALGLLGPHLYPSAFTNRGVAELMLGQADAALADFRHAIDLRRAYPESVLNPSYAKWRAGMAASYCGVGQVSLRRGDLDGALEAYNEAISYNPDDLNGYVGRGRALAGLGRYPEALGDYDAALRLDPNDSRALGYRAATLAQVGRTLDAVGDLGRAVQGDPAAGAARRLKAAYLAKLGRLDEAVRELDEALRLDPKDAGAWKDRGALKAQKGEPAQALPDLDQALALDSNSAKAYQNRAGVNNALGRHNDAVRDADAALRLDPKNAGAMNNRGLARLGLGEYETAVADLTAAIALDENVAAPYLNRGGALMMLGRHDDAAADYALAVRLEPRLSQTYSSPSAIPELLRLRPRSTSDDLAIRQAPVSPTVGMFERGNALGAAGDWTAAAAEYSKALAADPRSSDALALRGWARLCAGEHNADADARAWFARSGWRDPLAPAVALTAVLAARRDGRDADATARLDEALANLKPDAWPAPVFRYLKRQTSDEVLLASASGADQTALAHAVIGFDLRLRGYRDVALSHLRQARDTGPPGSSARALAAAQLRQAGDSLSQATPPASAPGAR